MPSVSVRPEVLASVTRFIESPGHVVAYVFQKPICTYCFVAALEEYAKTHSMKLTARGTYAGERGLQFYLDKRPISWIPDITARRNLPTECQKLKGEL